MLLGMGDGVVEKHERRDRVFVAFDKLYHFFHGDFPGADFSEGIILEVVGDKGVLRINLALVEINQNV